MYGELMIILILVIAAPVFVDLAKEWGRRMYDNNSKD